MRVGILGSGLMGGELGTLFARAGHEVVFSYARSEQKLKRLAREAMLWSDTAALKRLANQFDLLISTVPRAYPMQPFVNLLKLDATLVNVGAMEDLQGINGLALVFGRKSVAGSVIGGVAETQEVIDYCAARNIKADIELIRVEDINRAFERVVNKDVRYRFVIDMASLKSAAGSKS